MQVEITQTTPLYRMPQDHGIFLQWTVLDPPSSALTFKLERSGSLQGPWELLMREIHGYHFTDVMRRINDPQPGEEVVNFNHLALTRTIYYRLTATSANGEVVSTVADVGASLPRRELLLKRKMQRDLAIGFKFNGVDIAVLKRRHWGVRCKRCFDPTTRKVLNSKCNVCYGTGFEGGYFQPVRIIARFLAPNSETQTTPHGKSDTTQIRVLCGQTPIIDPDDILVEIKQNRRYVVVAQSESQLRRETVHQSLVVSELSRDSVEYRFPANLDHIPVIY